MQPRKDLSRYSEGRCRKLLRSAHLRVETFTRELVKLAEQHVQGGGSAGVLPALLYSIRERKGALAEARRLRAHITRRWGRST